MSIKDKINHDLKEAMRAKDKDIVSALRLITAAIKQVEVDERIPVDDNRILVVLDKLAKQRKESISQFESAGRSDLVLKEEFELKVLERYLPAPLSQDEINLLIHEAIEAVNAEKMSDMGKVMAHLKPKLQGRADMSKVSAIIKTKLN